MSAEFPRRDLDILAVCLANEKRYADAATVILALNRYDELALRVCEDNAKASITIGNLREENAGLREQIRQLENNNHGLSP